MGLRKLPKHRLLGSGDRMLLVSPDVFTLGYKITFVRSLDLQAEDDVTSSLVFFRVCSYHRGNDLFDRF